MEKPEPKIEDLFQGIIAQMVESNVNIEGFNFYLNSTEYPHLKGKQYAGHNIVLKPEIEKGKMYFGKFKQW